MYIHTYMSPGEASSVTTTAATSTDTSAGRTEPVVCVSVLKDDMRC